MRPLVGSIRASIQASILVFVLALYGATALAQSATVTHLVGTLSVTKADGAVRLLSQKSRIAPGDTIATERDSYAQIVFADGTRMTLKRTE